MEAKMYRKIVCILLSILLCVSLQVYAQPPIEIIFFKPADVEKPNQNELDSLIQVITEVQSFFASEMERHGFSPKTFEFDKNIKVVNGQQNREYYNVDRIKNETYQIDFEVQNKITVVFIKEKKFIHGGAPGVMLPLCWEWPGQPRDINDCNYLPIIGTGYKEHLSFVTAHEIGHSFGLLHPPKATTDSGLKNIMYEAPTLFIGVKEELKDYAVSREDAIRLDKSGRLSIQENITLSINTNRESVPLSFLDTSGESLKATNAADKWDGWVIGIWEKPPGGIPPPKPNFYFNFPEMNSLSHWMYSHAPSEIEYNVSNENYTTFGAYFILPHAQLDNPNFCTQGMIFTAHANNIEIYTKDLYLDDYGTYIEFEIPESTKKLTLNVGDLKDMTCDHYVLGEPKLFKKETSLQAKIDADVNDDGYVDLHDVRIVRSGTQNSTSYDTDINNDGVTDEIDVMLVKAAAHAAIAAAAPRKQKVKLTTWGDLKRQ